MASQLPKNPIGLHQFWLRIGVLLLLLGLVSMLSGCQTTQTQSSDFVDDVRIEPVADVPGQVQVPARVSQVCKPFQPDEYGKDYPELKRIIFGPGDVIKIEVADGPEFSGLFTLNYDGSISLPYAGRVMVAGRTQEAVSALVKEKLVAGKYFKAGFVQVAAVPMRLAPINILVSGAVYNPGRATINDLPAEKRDLDALNTIGDAPISRYLDAGLRAGAGLRPDADITRIGLTRNGKRQEINLVGLITGSATPDIPLMPGDKIDVVSSGCFHPELMRPSQATPPGMRVFMSNLTVPATGNNPSAVDNYATNLPYGTRLLQAATSSNCVGGAHVSNAHRRVVMMSQNPLTGKAEVIDRSIEGLFRNVNNQNYNPFLLPNDAIACYDSGITNIREVARTLSEVLSPIGILAGLL